ncbi:circadian oscillation regulator KaiC-like protein, partial [Mesorhizobium alhagi CCNWXJ12-2]
MLVLLFDETRRIFLDRAAGLNMALDTYWKSDMLLLDKIEPAEISAGELSSRIQSAVERSGTRIVI